MLTRPLLSIQVLFALSRTYSPMVIVPLERRRRVALEQPFDAGILAYSIVNATSSHDTDRCGSPSALRACQNQQSQDDAGGLPASRLVLDDASASGAVNATVSGRNLTTLQNNRGKKFRSIDP